MTSNSPTLPRTKMLAITASTLLISLMLGSCNTTSPAPMKVETGDSFHYAAPLNTAELSGRTCGEPIIAYRNLIDRDVRTGFLGQSVYNRIAPQVASAATTCLAGNSAAALESLRATKRQFGYPS